MCATNSLFSLKLEVALYGLFEEIVSESHIFINEPHSILFVDFCYVFLHKATGSRDRIQIF